MSDEVEATLDSAAPSGVGFRHASVQLKEEGNSLFAAQEYAAAADRYRAAIAQARCGGGDGSFRLEAECQCNIAQCMLCVGDFGAALAAAEGVLGLARATAAVAAASAGGSSASATRRSSSAGASAASASAGSGSGSGGGSQSAGGGAAAAPAPAAAAAAANALPPQLVEKCLLRRARALRGLQRDKEALQAYKALLKFSPSSADGRRELAAMLPAPAPAQGLTAKMAGALRAAPGALYEDQPTPPPPAVEEDGSGWEGGCCYELWKGLCCCFRRGRAPAKED